MQLYQRYPNLHVYAYGPLPCVDSTIAEACSHFVTRCAVIARFLVKKLILLRFSPSLFLTITEVVKWSLRFCSIVLNNEFSSRLSAESILRLRAAAITALSEDSTADMTMIFRLARRFLYVSNFQRNRTEVMEPASNPHPGSIRSENLSHHAYESQDLFDSRGNFTHYKKCITKYTEK